MRVLCAAENFAYGPAGKLLTIARVLAARGHGMVFVGTGTALDLASKSSLFEEVVAADTEAPDFARSHERLVLGADVVLSAMDRGAVAAGADFGVPTVWVDSLFYWWEELPDPVLAADLYVKQDVLPDANGMARFASRIRNLRAVGPIVDVADAPTAPRTGRVLVNYGGMDAPGWYEAGRNHRYPYVVTELVLDALRGGGRDDVLFAGASRIMDELREEHGATGARFASLDHDEFVATLRSSDLVLLPGGMESTLEAFANGVPALFLPPLNVTHHLHVTAFRELGLARCSIGLADYHRLPDWSAMDRRRKVDSFMELARTWQSDAATTADMARRVRGWLADPHAIEEQEAAQRRFHAGLRPDGVHEVADLVEGLVLHRRPVVPSLGGAR